MRPSRAVPRRAVGAVTALAALLAVLALAGCGGGGGVRILHAGAGASGDVSDLGVPLLATRNTTRIDGATPVQDAAAVALAVYPSQSAGSHPTAVTVAPTDDWEAALAASVLMAAPVHAPVLLSGPSGLPRATATALRELAPTGAGSIDGARVVRVGRVGRVASSGHGHVATVDGAGPYALAAAIDRFQSAAAGQPSADVVVTSTSAPAYAMPAAGWAAESGDPILYVSPSGVPAATAQALRAHGHPHVYVLDPPSVLGASVMRSLRRFGTVKRIAATSGGPAASSATFAAYRDPACPPDRPCAHIAGSFGWALRSPGHGYTLLAADRTLDAAASAALSGSGDYGPQLLTEDPDTLSRPVLDFLLDYATPGYTAAGPTVGVYNHGWVIGGTSAVSLPVQSQFDGLLQIVPVQAK